jgi:DNA-binding PadR family transcriptional regulator
MSKERDLVRVVAEPIVLRLLSEREMYGYEIIKVVNERSGGIFDWKEGTLYPCLHRLEGRGLVKGEWMKAGKERRRKYYRLTHKGHGALKSKVEEWKSYSEATNRLLSQLSPA